jgi:hypothetical protein
MIDEALGPKNDFYIKLTNEAAMLTVLSDFYNEEGEFVSNTTDYAIDVVGTIYEATGVTLTDADGMDYPEAVAVTGWHLNIRLLNDTKRTIIESIDEFYGVTPTSPSRLWL